MTTIEEAVAYYEANEPKGECVLVIEGKSADELIKEEQAQWEELSVAEHVDMYMKKGMSKKEAMKQAAKDRGVSKRDIYQRLLEMEG